MNGLIRASLRNPVAVTVTMLTIIVLGILSVTQIPIDILPMFQQSGRAGADVLRRHARQQHREGHNQPHGALDGPVRRHEAAGVPLDRRRQHRPQLLPQRRRPQRRLDASELAGDRRDPQPATRHAAACRTAV